MILFSFFYRIPFSAASSATPYKRNFRLVYLSEANEHEEIELKLARPRMAIALYRSITEKHAFYSCETVGSDVTKQFIRDFKVCYWLSNDRYHPKNTTDKLNLTGKFPKVTLQSLNLASARFGSEQDCSSRYYCAV